MRVHAPPGAHLRRDALRTAPRPHGGSNLNSLVERHFPTLPNRSEAKVGPQGLRPGQIVQREPRRRDGDDGHGVSVSGMASPHRAVCPLQGCGLSGDRSPCGQALGRAGTMPNCTLGVERHFPAAGKRNCGRWGVQLSQVYVVSRREARVTDLTTQARRVQSASATASLRPQRAGRRTTCPGVDRHRTAGQRSRIQMCRLAVTFPYFPARGKVEKLPLWGAMRRRVLEVGRMTPTRSARATPPTDCPCGRLGCGRAPVGGWPASSSAGRWRESHRRGEG